MLQWLSAMNNFINISFVAGAFLLDSILQSIFPVDFEMRRLFVVFNMGIMALLLLLRKESFLKVLIIAFAVGFALDFVRYGYFFLNALSFSLSLLLIRVWSNQINESIIELIILSVLAVFVKEVIEYGLLFMSNLTHLNPLNWFIYRGFLTILMHIPLSLVVLYFNNIREESLDHNLRVKRKMESALYKELRKPRA